MYALIDKATMEVKYIHYKQSALWAVANIEYQGLDGFRIVPLVKHCFFTYTGMELVMLYRNLTGDKILNYDRDSIIERILARLMEMPESDIDEQEAQAQVRYALANLDNTKQYRYARGSSVPATVQSSLFK